MGLPTTPYALFVYQALAGYPATGEYGALAADDPVNDWALSKWVTAICAPGEDAFKALLGDDLDAVWASLNDPEQRTPLPAGVWLDPVLCPESFVHYNAVLRGVDTRGVDIDTLRAWCADGGPTRQRGSDEAMRLKVMQVLTGTKTVRIYPRTNPDVPGDQKWNTLIRVSTDEAPRTPTTLGSQMYSNTSFETDLSGWDIDGGEFVGAPASTPTRVADADTSSGYAMEIVAAAGAPAYQGAEHVFTTVVGQRYTAEGYLKKTAGADVPQLVVGETAGVSTLAAKLQTLSSGYEEWRLDFVAEGTSYKVAVRESPAGTGVTFRAAGVTVRPWDPEPVIVAAARDRAAAVWQRVHAQVLDGDAIDELVGAIEDLTGDIEDL